MHLFSIVFPYKIEESRVIRDTLETDKFFKNQVVVFVYISETQGDVVEIRSLNDLSEILFTTQNRMAGLRIDHFQHAPRFIMINKNDEINLNGGEH